MYTFAKPLFDRKDIRLPDWLKCYYKKIVAKNLSNSAEANLKQYKLTLSDPTLANLTLNKLPPPRPSPPPSVI